MFLLDFSGRFAMGSLSPLLAGLVQPVQLQFYYLVQRTGVDKILAIRLWGGVGGANVKNMYTPLVLAPQTRHTTEY